MTGETQLAFILGPVVSYFIGSIPFAYIVARVFGGLDIRQHGSGNVGATNVARVMGWRYGVPVFLLDALKGFLPAYLAIKYFGLSPVHPLVILCGAGAVLGHVFPIYLRFKGGKAAATSVGVFLVLAPKAILGAILVWCIIVAVTRYISLGTIFGAIALCALFVYFHPDPFGDGRYLMGVSVIIALLIILRHKENIGRLIAGTEPKVGQGGAAS
jgi:glycerol-3-phosphate acyltransferase PlsY